MIEFFRKLFAPETSGATARERLRLVLLSDHLSLAPDVVTALRADLIAVISKYVEVDEANCDVSFEQQDRAVAVLANIPILALRGRTPPAAPSRCRLGAVVTASCCPPQRKRLRLRASDGGVAALRKTRRTRRHKRRSTGARPGCRGRPPSDAGACGNSAPCGEANSA